MLKAAGSTCGAFSAIKSAVRYKVMQFYLQNGALL
jgi:hypothetical protein